MLILNTPRDFAAHRDTDLGVTAWRDVTQAQIDAFAALSGDDFWIHTDVSRAAREAAGGKTIAHGLYLMSLIPVLQRQLFRIESRGVGLNYGYDKVRFTAPVPVDSQIRLHQRITSALVRDDAVRIGLRSTIELNGSTRPALVQDGLLLVYV